MTRTLSRISSLIAGAPSRNWQSSAAAWKTTTPPSTTRCGVWPAAGSSSSRRRRRYPKRSAPKPLRCFAPTASMPSRQVFTDRGAGGRTGRGDRRPGRGLRQRLLHRRRPSPDHRGTGAPRSGKAGCSRRSEKRSAGFAGRRFQRRGRHHVRGDVLRRHVPGGCDLWCGW